MINTASLDTIDLHPFAVGPQRNNASEGHREAKLSFGCRCTRWVNRSSYDVYIALRAQRRSVALNKAVPWGEGERSL
jgi:hypothetical protein